MDEGSSVVKMMQSYINGSPNGMGFLIGVKAFAKLYRSLFCMPVSGREGMEDVINYDESSQVHTDVIVLVSRFSFFLER